MDFVTRFAPSPTGPLHLGHAYSALLAHDMARTNGGAFLLRIEDIDHSRCRPAWEAQIYEDLQWLGVDWDGEVMRQSERMPAYRSALEKLWQSGLIYPCTCTRRDIEAAMSAPQEGAEVPHGPDGLVYLGTCRKMFSLEQTFPENYSIPESAALRFKSDLAGHLAFDHRADPRTPHGSYVASYREIGDVPRGADGLVEFTDREFEEGVGDFVIARRDMGTSYHLSVVLDDAAQGVTHVVRGADLFEATRIHVILQKVLGLPTPIYHHHRLIRDEAGKRLAKRDDARALAKYRAEGASPADIRRMVGL